MKKTIRIITVLSLAILLSICVQGTYRMDSIVFAQAESISLSKNSVKKYTGDTKKLKVNGISSLTVKKIEYVSKNKKVAVVNKTGEVTAKKAGTTKIIIKITYSDGNNNKKTKRLSCKVKVIDAVIRDAMNYLKGTWERDGGRPSITRAVFTDSSCTYTSDSGDSWKVKIVGIEKTTYGYFLKMKSGYAYRLDTEEPKALTCVGTWDAYSMEGYSGSSSYTKVK